VDGDERGEGGSEHREVALLGAAGASLAGALRKRLSTW
jgi:hypothetical protein